MIKRLANDNFGNIYEIEVRKESILSMKRIFIFRVEFSSGNFLRKNGSWSYRGFDSIEIKTKRPLFFVTKFSANFDFCRKFRALQYIKGKNYKFSKKSESSLMKLLVMWDKRRTKTFFCLPQFFSPQRANGWHQIWTVPDLFSIYCN